VRYRRIPNWLTAGGAAVAVLLNAFLFQTPGAFIFRYWPGVRSSLLGLVLAFGVYFVLHVLHAMGAGDVKLMAAVGALTGPRDWFGIFVITAILGGLMALILVVAKKRIWKTAWNLGFIVGELTHGKAAYMSNEELDVKSPKALRMPHGAVIAVGTLFFLALSAHFTR